MKANQNQNQSASRPENPVQSSKRNGQDREIAMEAYYIWEKEGRPHGRELDHWLSAEHKVRRLINSNQTRKPAR